MYHVVFVLLFLCQSPVTAGGDAGGASVRRERDRLGTALLVSHLHSVSCSCFC